MEIFKDIQGYEWIYQVSNIGNIKRLAKEIIRNNWWVQTFKEKQLKISNDSYWYWQISLAHLWIVKKAKPHRLVIQAFVWEIPIDKQINHINWNKLDNRLENAETTKKVKNMT